MMKAYTYIDKGHFALLLMHTESSFQVHRSVVYRITCPHSPHLPSDEPYTLQASRLCVGIALRQTSH